MKKKEEDEYYLASEYDSDNFHIRIHRPIITEEERARRMKQIERAAADLLIEQMMMEREAKKEGRQ